jgi:hypothetical protein
MCRNFCAVCKITTYQHPTCGKQCGKRCVDCDETCDSCFIRLYGRDLFDKICREKTLIH